MKELNSATLKLIVVVSILFIVSGCSFEKMFYYPDRTLSNQELADSLGFVKVSFPSKNTKIIHGYWVECKDSALASILFLHGNAGDINDRIKSLEILRNNGFNVLIIDYQGFGLSQGEVSHQNLVDDAESALKYLQNLNKVEKLPMLILGRSIGGHLAVKIAHDHQDVVKALVIEGAFTNHHRIAVQLSPFFIQPFAELLVKSSYKASDLIKEVSIPKLIIHSTADETIPYWMGVDLYNKAPEPKQFWKIDGCHICGLSLYSKEYIEKLRKIINSDN